MRLNHQQQKRALRNKIKRKRRHRRQLESRLKNEYEQYIIKMNNFEYNTWISEVSNKTIADKIYSKQVALKNKINDDLTNRINDIASYDIIDNTFTAYNTSNNNTCLIS